MHEVSLARSIFRTLEEEFPAEKMDRLVGINLKVGLLSNVEPLLMQNAFQALLEAEAKPPITLNIETVPITVYCTACERTSEIQQYKFVCQGCGQPNNNIIQGTELLIHQVHFHEN